MLISVEDRLEELDASGKDRQVKILCIAAVQNYPVDVLNIDKTSDVISVDVEPFNGEIEIKEYLDSGYRLGGGVFDIELNGETFSFNMRTVPENIEREIDCHIESSSGENVDDGVRTNPTTNDGLIDFGRIKAILFS